MVHDASVWCHVVHAQAVRDNAALNEFEWQLLSYWIPTIVSATVLLVFMKGAVLS